MARHFFGGDVPAWVYNVLDANVQLGANGSQLVTLAPNASATVRLTPTGAAVTDLLLANNTAPANGLIVASGAGTIARFQGPDNVTALYVDSGGGPQLLLANDHWDTLSGKLDASSVGAANGVAALDGQGFLPVAQVPALPQYATTRYTREYVEFDFAAGVYPLRPAFPAGVRVEWGGPSFPPVGGGYAIDVDTYLPL